MYKNPLHGDFTQTAVYYIKNLSDTKPKFAVSFAAAEPGDTLALERCEFEGGKIAAKLLTLEKDMKLESGAVDSSSSKTEAEAKTETETKTEPRYVEVRKTDG